MFPEKVVTRKKSKKKSKIKTKRPVVQSSQFWDTSDVVIAEDQQTDKKFKGIRKLLL